MSIRPDTWIKKMALEKGMIDPFVEEQVRVVEGRAVISYGLSSYGYDIRVADQFQIFTNVYGSVVDPKAFDPKGLNAAHKYLPLPTYVRVTNLENRRSIIIRVNDRGPFVKGRIIDRGGLPVREQVFE